MKQTGAEWVDARGNAIPIYAISNVLKIEEKHAQRVATAALRAEKALQAVEEAKAKAYVEIRDAKIADAKLKGNVTSIDGFTFTSFDNSIEVKITMPDNVYFDATYTDIVKQKFDEYFKSFGNENEIVTFLRDLVNNLLFTSGGRLDMSKVLSLRSMRDRVNEEKKLSANKQLFLEAVDLFDKAVRKKPGNSGLYVSVLDTENQKMRRVALKYTDL